MKPTLTTPDTLHLSLWAQGDDALVLPSYRDADGVLAPLTGWFKGPVWGALACAVEVTAKVRPGGLLVVSNVRQVVQSIAPTLCLLPHACRRDNKPAPLFDLTRETAALHQEAIGRLSVLYGGRCSAYHADHMPRTEDAWQQHYTASL